MMSQGNEALCVPSRPSRLRRILPWLFVGQVVLTAAANDAPARRGTITAGRSPSTATSAAPAASPGASVFPARKPALPKPVRASTSTVPTFVELAQQLGPAVVSVTATRLPDEEGPRRRGREQGTGVIINESGHILTNNHVVENAAEVRVRLQDERELSAKVIGRDERTDIALLKIDAGATLPWATLGDSDAVRIGEWVMAIGNPFGLDHSVTIGVVSAKGRREVQPGNSQGFFDFIQTDAPINPGNSGGPLFSVRGEVIGINTAVTTAGSGIGFAIPANIARAIADQLHKQGRVLRSWLGIYPQPVTEALRLSLKLPDRKGALLAEVFDNSPAAAAGLMLGDVVLEFDGKPVRRSDDLMWLLGQNNKRSVAVGFVRGGAARSTLVQFGEPDPPRPEPPVTPHHPTALGIAVAELTPAMAQKIGYDQSRGLVIMTLEPGSPAEQAGVERGDILLRIGDQPVGDLLGYAEAMKSIASGQLIRLLLRREERKQWHNVWVAFPRR